MDDQVPFKVYTFWSEDSKPEVRRFGVDKSVVTSFHYLTAKLLDLFPGLREKKYTVSWKDEDGDDVTVSSDAEMLIALSQVFQDMVKLNIHVKETETEDTKDEACNFFAAAFSDASAAAAQAGVPLTGIPHVGVMCDSCDGPVVGFRYKCASCPDYDLCARCEGAGLHAEHCMVRVPAPLMPRHLIKAAIKRSRHFLKTVAVGEECPYKKNKREKSGERKHFRREHQGERHARHERHERRPRASWLDTFATYINEFANLAGDVDCHPPGSETPGTSQNPQAPTQGAQAPTNTTQAAQTEPNTEHQSTSTENQATGEKTNGGGPFEPDFALDKLLNPDNVKYLLDLQKSLTGILIPNLLPQAGKSSTSTPPPTPAADVEMGHGDRKEQSPDKVSVKSESSTSSTSSEGDKAEDWTVINKENDLMDVGKPIPSAPEPITPIGFNLPEEFQKRVSINPAQNIYPPLHAASAVLDPIPAREQTPPQNVPVQPAPAPAPAPAQPQPAPSQPQAAASQPQPRRRHPKAHIEAAIQQMLTMGFNNDSGWLTQLLETKDGNISAVLDLLTPVASQRK